MAADLTLVDFHAHYAGPAWPAAGQGRSDGAWPGIAARIADAGDLVPALDAARLDVRVVGAPPSLLTGGWVRPSTSTVRAVNEHLAGQIARAPDRLRGLATIDAFAGDEAAREVERAIRELGLGGIVVDCATDDAVTGAQRLLDAPQALPTLQAAAALRAPVLAHPLSPTRLTEVLGRGGVRLARSTVATQSLLAVIGSGVPDSAPGVRLVFPWLGGALGLLLTATTGPGARLRRAEPPATRWHVYVDTMSLDAGWIRYAVDALGADHVLLGTDWPIQPGPVTRGQIARTLEQAGLTEAERRQVAGANALALLRPPTA